MSRQIARFRPPAEARGVGLSRWLLAQLRSRFADGLDLLYPPACLYCGDDLSEPVPSPLICAACADAFMKPAHACCAKCGTVLPPAAGLAPCVACRERKFRFDSLLALGDYRDDLRSAVLKAKRPNGEPLARALAKLLVRTHQDRLREWQIDAVIAVPMHWSRRMIRGANAPDVVSREVATVLRIPCSPLLKRRRRTRPQGTLSPSRRAVNVRGAFVLKHAEDFRGARILIVDDVVTSGATSNEAAKVLKRAGAAFVGVAAIARTQPTR